jgi:hypothetical protein
LALQSERFALAQLRLDPGGSGFAFFQRGVDPFLLGA